MCDVRGSLKPGFSLSLSLSPCVYIAALKFFRTCIGLDDDSYHQELITENVVQHIVELLLETGAKNNLVNSLCLEFFEHIRTVSCTCLTMAQLVYFTARRFAPKGI